MLGLLLMFMCVMTCNKCGTILLHKSGTTVGFLTDATSPVSEVHITSLQRIIRFVGRVAQSVER